MHASLDPVFVACWTTGPDPNRDGVFRLEATAFPAEDGAVEIVPATWMRPFAGIRAGSPLSRRLRALGLEKGAEEDLPAQERALPELLGRLAARPLVVAGDRAGLLARFRRHLPEAEPPIVLDLEGFATLLHPRRGERGFPWLWRRHLGGEPPAEPRPADLARLLAALVERHFEREDALRQLFARAFEELQAACDDREAEGVEWLELARRLLDRPSRYAAAVEPGLFRRPPEDGRFSADLDEAPLEAERLLDRIQPAFAAEYEAFFADAEPLPSREEEEPAPLDDADHRILEAFFDHLPRLFHGGGGAERPGQRALAHAVRSALEEHELLIADAPTGTGKTLAYLAPLLLWSSARGVRVAVSTYTRTLQEQAFFREVPRALELLRRAGLPEERLPRVSMLKGRANSICGRAIVDAAPDPGSGSPAARATWLRLALHFCEDPAADLDGFPLAPGPPLGHPARVLRIARAKVDEVRSLPRCCEGRPARRCAAGVRTLRAERSHLVVTNHAYVLARPDAFSHLVFDECDHLHEVTISARSFDIDLEEVAELVAELRDGRGRDRAPLQRLARLLRRLPEGDLGADLVEAATAARTGADELDATVHLCCRELNRYREYRRERGERLSPEERAFLLHDYLETGPGDALATALNGLKEAVDRLDSALRTTIEELGAIENRRARALRLALRRPLEPLAHWREGLFLWLGGHDVALGEGDEGDFSEDFHYDAEFENRRRPLLVLKWLLPQKWLGETYYPSLRGAAFVSATARIKGGFKAMKGYLGLDIVQEETVDRPGRVVREFAGPPTFDPGQALICVPEDAPPYATHGPAHRDWLDYVGDCLLYLAERTRGRILGLFTNRLVLQRVGERLASAFAARGIPLFWQGMPGLSKEEIMERFRSRVDSVLLGVDTFWYGVDFPGETCEYVVMTKLPFGVLDDYHYAQRARMGYGPQRNRIYLPKALAMFRQGCGRLLRHEDDRGAVLILDRRILERRHGAFLDELPGGAEEFERPAVLVAPTDECFHRIFAHMRLGAEIRRRGLEGDFSACRGLPAAGA
ncbi:MAG: hypothetical protein D6702_07940 [Planctomycetota bacterium]|nr:MAG: hypothetical protein D6702_07940 [Planctomycetota bacterium]